MKIAEMTTNRIAVPLKKPFKTALRTVRTAEAVIVKLTAENGMTGWGEAPPTAVITGETLDSIEGAVNTIFAPALSGRNLRMTEAIFHDIDKLIVGNTSAKAAVETAVYDCLAQLCGLPLYQLLGGYRREIETDFTVSVNDPEEMGKDAARYVKEGFRTLKIKVGKKTTWQQTSNESGKSANKRVPLSGSAWTPIKAGRRNRLSKRFGKWRMRGFRSSLSNSRSTGAISKA